MIAVTVGVGDSIMLPLLLANVQPLLLLLLGVGLVVYWIKVVLW